MNWKKYKEEKPPEGEEVLAYHPSDMSLRMSQHQLALIIKGILSNNEMMMMDVLQWCSERFKNSIEKGKKSTN